MKHDDEYSAEGMTSVRSARYYRLVARNAATSIPVFKAVTIWRGRIDAV